MMTALHTKSVDVERSVLGSIMRDKEAIYKVVDIITDVNMFDLPNNKIIYSAIMALYEAQKPIDIVTVCNKLKGDLQNIGGRLYIVNLMEETMTSNNIEEYCNIIKEYYTKRQAIKLCNLASDSLEDSDIKSADAIGNLKGGLDILVSGGDSHLHNMSDLSLIAKQRIHDAEEGKIEFLYSGFSLLDNKIGGYCSGELITIGGFTSHGKTTFALQVAMNLAAKQSKPVGIASYEMDQNAVYDRMLCIYSGVDYTRIKQGMLNEDEWKKIEKADDKLKKLSIKILYDPGCNITQLVARMKRYKRELGTCLWVVDYLQLIPTSNIRDRRLQVEDITRKLKLGAGDVGVPIIALSQLSRSINSDSYPPEPNLAKLRESGSIEQDSDVVQFVYRSKENDASVIVAKQRMATTGKIPMSFANGRWGEPHYGEEYSNVG